MSRRPKLSAVDKTEIKALVEFYKQNMFRATQVVEIIGALFKTAPELANYLHSVKSRIKDPTHVKDKLERKYEVIRNNGDTPDVTRENFFRKITDCAGFRLIHIHTSQAFKIHEILMAQFESQQYVVIEPAQARTWDIEYKEKFAAAGIATLDSPSYYTSIHYVVALNENSAACEIQVRTLAEEIWGEVSHLINYPHESKSVACEEQIMALARVTSSCTRLVDSLFATKADLDMQKEKSQKEQISKRKNKTGTRRAPIVPRSRKKK